MKDSDIEIAWEGPPQCQHCGIRDMVLFADLQRDDFKLIHKPIDELYLEAGEFLYRAGGQPLFVFTVRAGLVKLVQFLPNGDQRIVRLLRQGDVVGLEALFNEAYRQDALILEPAALCRIPVMVVERLSQDTPRLHRQLMIRWHRAVKEADDWLTELSTGSAPARVARLFLRLAEHNPEAIAYVPSREDMGAMLSISTETASRVTAQLKRSGVIRPVGTKHARVDVDALRHSLDA